MSKRVIIAMSGGVDSSVAAALLVEQGYDVVGVYILGWTGNDQFPCSWQKEEADARSVAEKLKIPFYTVNLSAEYYDHVIKNFFEEYRKGNTPNPDILCNREIKFKALWQAVRQFEPEFIATGHYARLRRKLPIINSQLSIAQSMKIENSCPRICEPADKEKDQTYFLWGIDKQMLPKILFPLGDITKTKVRELAKKYSLPTATKKDSQGICFIGQLKVREFLKSQLTTKQGDVVLGDGRKVATHQGVSFYTIGQRLGAGSVDWTGDVPPLYVIAKDIAKNILVVGPDKETFADTLQAIQPNWLVDETKLPTKVLARVRYRQALISASLQLDGGTLKVVFDEPVRAITAGQSVVFYDTKKSVLGGAIIAAVPAQQKIITKLHGRIHSKSSIK
ncbi:MAG TPA: tRNA 2-thiouridine(34) synthase MnmA [Candidatus Saccharimonadales bacterium]|nr:tRNA 2-thiouridine(34) synthase MnmA [Candidatus Saccharimonadales bacterium]